MRKLVIFDFDGTLVDTLEDVSICFNESLRQNGFPPRSLEYFRTAVGGNLETVVGKLLPEGSKDDSDAIDRVKTLYRKLYLESSKEHSKPFPGMREVLASLAGKGIAAAINTNKGQQLTDAMVEQIFAGYPFSGIFGYREDLPSKPDPYGVFQLMAGADATRSQTLYVGDGKSDIDTAANAGIDIALVPWGQGTPADWADPRVAVRVQDANELLDCIFES